MTTRGAVDTISIREAARLLGISVYTLYYWAQARRVPHYRIGRRVLFSRSELVDWLRKHRIGDVG